MKYSTITMKKFLSILLISFAASQVYAQTESTIPSAIGRGPATTFVTDYQSLGINPANLGLDTTLSVRIGGLETGITIYTGDLNRNDIFGKTTFKTQVEKIAAAKKFQNSPYSLNIDMMSLGAGVSVPAVGGFAFSAKDHIQIKSQFGSTLTDLLFLGSNSSYFDKLILDDNTEIKNDPNLDQATRDKVVKGVVDDPNNAKTVAQLMDGSKLEMSWMREYNLGYGRTIINTEGFKLAGGISVKYMQGYGILELEASGGKLNSFSAISPEFASLFDTAVINNPSPFDGKNLLFPKPAGKGFGMDFGVTIVIKDKLTVAAALNNIGSMNWEGVGYAVDEDFTLLEMESKGLESYNILSQIPQFVGEGSAFTWEKTDGKKKVALPSNIRFGASYKLGKIVEAGADIVIPGNDVVGNLDKALIAVGGDIKPLPFLRISTGMTFGGNFHNRLTVPLGIGFNVANRWEAGFSVRDITSILSKEGRTYGATFGFLRFKVL